MNIICRRPGQDEVDELAALHVKCWQQAYAGILDVEFLRTLDPSYRAAIWREVIADPGMFAEVAYAGSEKVGFIIAGTATAECRHWADGEIRALYLLQPYQRQGIGQQLLQRAVAGWQDRGGTALVAMAFAANAGARRFYEAQGAVVAGQMEIDLAGQQLVEVAHIFILGRV